MINNTLSIRDTLVKGLDVEITVNEGKEKDRKEGGETLSSTP